MPISLVKGEKIKLTKDDGNKLEEVCVGVNWGAIQKKVLFFKTTEAVDLDASAILFDKNNNIIEPVYFGNLKSKDGAVKHSGDDLVGDEGGDDGLDNEIISINLNKLSSNVDKIVFILNSYRGQDFAIVPFATMRFYEGTPTKVKNVIANYNIAGDPKFSGHVAMVLGKIYKHNNEWKAEAIGEPTRDKTLKETIETVMKSYL